MGSRTGATPRKAKTSRTDDEYRRILTSAPGLDALPEELAAHELGENWSATYDKECALKMPEAMSKEVAREQGLGNLLPHDLPGSDALTRIKNRAQGEAFQRAMEPVRVPLRAETPEEVGARIKATNRAPPLPPREPEPR